MKKRDYNKFDFASLVKLDATSPSGLSWIAPRMYGGRLNYKRVGSPAGNIKNFNNRQDYYIIVVFNAPFFVHRIVYLLANGYVNAANDIDHIDGNSLNNSVENLREVSAGENSRNRRKKTDKELDSGVYLETYIAKSGRELQKVRAHYSVEGKVYNRSWSTLKRGYAESVRLATEWRDKQINDLNTQGFGYTERHGT